MQFDQKTFCAASWFQLRNATNGSYRVCCAIDHSKSDYAGQKDYAWPASHWQEFHNSDYVQYLRQNLTNGNQLPECATCWKHEALGQTSLRQMVNDSCTRNHGNDLSNTWIAPFMKHKQDFTSDLVISADVKLTNLCNFSCVMCHSKDSSQIYSQWSHDLDHPAVKLRLGSDPKSILDQARRIFMDNDNHDLLEKLLALKPRNLKILGGEPLLDTKCLDILSTVPYNQKQHTSLCVVTNGSQDLTDAYLRLSQYQNVHFVISVDGIGAVQEYIRKGSDWKIIETNIDRFLAQFPGHLGIHHTSQALNVHVIPDLMRWCKARGIQSSVYYLSNPLFMSYSAIPDSLRQKIVDDLACHSIDPAVAAVVTELRDSRWVPEHTQQLRTYLEWYDVRGERYSTLPHWTPYV